VLGELNRERPQLKTFATLSPAPGFCDWLAGATEDELAPAFTEDERAGLRALTDSGDLREGLTRLLARPGWQADESATKILKSPAMRLCARYLMIKRDDGRPIAVARFHLKNGARLERINWMGDGSPNGLRRSLGLMVNYRYIREDVERNHEAYMAKGKVAISSDIKALAKAMR
jgi:malonyl-CoA decarboxylase